jgi:hypothetical protein
MKERHILAHDADPELLDRWLGEQGFARVLDQTRAHLFPRLLRWEGPEGTVTWVEDHRLGVRCLEIRCPLPDPPVAKLSVSRLLETSGHDPDARRALEYLNATEVDFWKSDLLD